MGLLKRLFGPPSKKMYVEEGCRLTKELVLLLDLTDWTTGLPSYTEAEDRAIDRGLLECRKLSGDTSRMRPDIVQTAERVFVSGALHHLAGNSWPHWEEYSPDECPEDWKARVSTYLKVWAMMLDPEVLLDLAGLLNLAGFNREAKKATAIVATWFSAYAPTYFGNGADPKLAEYVSTRAIELMAKL